MGLTLYEQETIINYNRAENSASLYTADPVMMRHMDALCKEQPDIFKLMKENYARDEDTPCSKEYEITDKKRIKITKKREYTEEQLEAMRENGRRLAGLGRLKIAEKNEDSAVY